MHRVADAGAFDTAQVSYNMLNPSAGRTVPAGYPAHDFGNLLAHTKAASMGVIAIRVLAAGALSGTEDRHPLGLARGRADRLGLRATGSMSSAPAGSKPLVREGFADSLIEAAIRFAIAHEAVSTALVGYSTLDQLEAAAAAAEKGPLPQPALARLAALQTPFAGEPR